MKKYLILLLAIFIRASSMAQVLDTPRYTVYFDKNGVQHTSALPTKLIAITGNLNDALIKFTTLSQSGIADVYTKTQSDALYQPIGSTGPISSVFGRTGAIIAANGDYTTSQVTEGTNLYWTTARGDARYALLTGSYTNPSWLISLPWSKITATPTTVSGYGITDALSTTSTINQLSKSANYTIVSTDFATGKQPILYLYVDCTSASLTETLPSATTFSGYKIYVTKVDATANTCTISGLSADNVISTKGWVKELYAINGSWINN